MTSPIRQLAPETTARNLGGSDIACLGMVLLVALLSRLIPAYFVGVEAADCTTVGGAMHPEVRAAIPKAVEIAGSFLRGGAE